MRIKSLLMACVLILSAFLAGGQALFNVKGKAVEEAFAEQAVTVGQMADFLANKKEHYPFSDQFMERYQQTSGGYLDNAKRAGILVDRTQHSPNQKWHFFESWYYPSLEDGTLTREDDAKSRIYTKLLCPELLLWIYEACGVEPIKVRNAMRAAERGKSSNVAVTSIAKSMRECVSWDDIFKAFQVKVPAEAVYLDKTAVQVKVGEAVSLTAAVSPASTTDAAIWSIVEGGGVISLAQKANQATITGVLEGSAKIKVLYNQGVWADCVITVVKNDQIIPDPDPQPDPVGGAFSYGVVYDLGTRVTAKQIETEDGVFAAFNYLGGGEGIINSVSDIAYIYGGAHGGSGEARWYTGDILKFGTTGVNGSLTLNLSSNVNYVKITGYVYASTCKITVGGKEVLCEDMTEVNKDAVEGGLASTIFVTFADTDSLTIATLNKKPLFITSIEIGYDSDLTA